jgi:uncharacterized protein YbaR (Trm112 family)
MQKYLLEKLECPACHHELVWDLNQAEDERIHTGFATCSACAAEYPVRDGIGIFLTPDLPREDMWEEAQSGLVDYLDENPEISRQLLESPLEDLNPTDQFYRAMLLDSQGDFQAADLAQEASHTGAYTQDYLRCWQKQFDYITTYLSAVGPDIPIVDLASGRGYLVDYLARRIDNPLVASDFSPRILRRNRQYFEYLGVYDRISLLAFDVRKTPFKTGSILLLTTNMGLGNVENPGQMAQELARIVSGEFLTICSFYPAEDEANLAVLKEHGLDTMNVQSSALQEFRRAGWQVSFENRCRGTARPTPKSRLIPGAGLDALPVADTTLDWGIIVARKA